MSHLISLYLIIPLFLAVVWLDQTYLNRRILMWAPFRPESWVLWIYLFGLPHVLGGINMFADTEYIKTYGWRLLRIFLASLALPWAIVQLLGEQSMLLAFMSLIVYHTIAQQFGLMLSALRTKPGFFFYLLKWSTIGVAGCIYVMLYSQPLPLALLDSGVGEMLVLMGKVLLVVVVVAGAAMSVIHRKNHLGVIYVIGNVALITAECVLFSERYFFLVVILGRVIHEFTAWHIYAVHDHNRNLNDCPNWLFRPFKGPIPTKVLSIGMAFAIGIGITFMTRSVSWLATLAVSLSVYHYYSEHFLWRRDGLLRASVRFI